MNEQTKRILIVAGLAFAAWYLWHARKAAAAPAPAAVTPLDSAPPASGASAPALTMAPSQVTEGPSVQQALAQLDAQPTVADTSQPATVATALPGPDAHQLHEEHLAHLAKSYSPVTAPVRGTSTVYMYDAIGSNAAQLRQFRPTVVAGYNTGYGVVPWHASTWAMFPGAVHVHIDQAGQGAPSRTAAVMDVEPGCYRPSQVPGWVRANRSGNPTVYCDRADLNAVLATGYKGPIWLAWPGWRGEALPSHQVVAVQSVFGSFYDRTTIIDPTWLAKGGGS